jgi:hypothetical protein
VALQHRDRRTPALALGHSYSVGSDLISITLDMFSHTIPAMQKSAAATVARLVFGS